MGVSYIIAKVARKTQISMTMDIYSDVLPSMQQDAMSKLHDALKRKDDEDNEGVQELRYQQRDNEARCYIGEKLSSNKMPQATCRLA